MRSQGFLYRGGYGVVRRLDWDEQGLWVCSSAGILLWEPREGELLSRLFTPILGAGRDGQGRFYTAAAHIDRWNSELQPDATWPPLEGPVEDLAVSPDGQLVALGRDGSLSVCDALGQVIRRVSTAAGNNRLRVDWSQRQAWTTGGRGAEQWDLDSGVRLSEQAELPPLALAEGDWSCDQKGRLLWQGQPAPFVRERLLTWAHDPGGEYLALASEHELVVVNRLSGELLHEWDDFREWPLCAAASPDGRWIVSGDRGGHLSQRRFDNGSLKQRWSAHEAAVTSVAFGQGVLLSAGADGSIRSWTWQGCDPLHTMSGHTAAVRQLVVDGSRLFSAGAEGQILIWDYLSGQVMSALTGYQSPVEQLQLLQRGEVLLALYADGSWASWDVSGYG
ncbi:hypothetical protein ABS71_03895 [bacterium SCN 62-11]|nr:MAG: hypothetical protein ABS71_03895 [bacterium SCN 62-11]